jgi:hypothetical protein
MSFKQIEGLDMSSLIEVMDGLVYVETFAILPAKIEFDRHLCLFAMQRNTRSEDFNSLKVLFLWFVETILGYTNSLFLFSLQVSIVCNSS